MLDVLEVQDQLKNFSQEQLLREMQMPTGNVPQFLVLSELNRRRTMSQDLAKRQSADQPTVKEEVVASSGMPMEKASMMAQQMAPQTSMSENTGIASMMPRELPSEEEPMKMSYGGLLMGSRMMDMAAPLARRIAPRPGLDREVTDMEYRPNRFPFPAMQGRFSSGLSNLGRDISGRVQNRTQEEVDDFIGEVDNMAKERFEVNLSEPSQRQRDMQSFLSGKGQPRMAMKDGGVIKAQNGMFADIGSAIASADAPTFSMPPAFASIYNFIKTNFPNLSDAEVRRQAQDVVEAQQNNEVPRIDAVLRPGLFKEYDMAKEQAELATSEKALREGLSSDANIPDISFSTKKAREELQKRIANSGQPPSVNAFRGLGGEYDAITEKLKKAQEANQALSNFTGGAEMSDLVNRLGKSSDDPKITTDNQMLVNALKTKDDIRNLKNKELQRIASMAALDNFSGGQEMSDLVANLGKGQTATQANQVGATSDPLIYDPTIYGESEEELAAQRFEKSVPLETEFIPYAFGYKPKTFGGKLLQMGAGAGSGTANLLLGNYPAALTKNVVSGASNILRKPLKADGTAYTQEEIDQSLLKYVGLPASMVDEFNKGITEELKDKAKKDKDAVDNFTGGEEMDNLVEKVTKEEKKKREAKKKSGDTDALGGLGGASGALSDLSAQIAELKEKREKGRESEKWFSLAKLGLGMLASASPTVFGALGEGGLKALEDFKAGKKAYDDDILGYLKTQASIEKSQAELGLKGLVARKQIEQLKKKGTATYGVKEIFDDIAKIDERLQGYSGAEYTIKSEDDLKEINRLRTRRLQLSNLLPAGLRPIEVDLATTASTS